MTSSRLRWGMSPWMHWASSPRSCRNLVSRSVEPLVLQKQMTRSSCWARMMEAMASTFLSDGTSMRYCRISGLFSRVAWTVISSGSR